MRITATAAVNVGKQRFNNEDNLCFNGEYLTEASRDAPFFRTLTAEDSSFGFCVCDGMGGESRGEEASIRGARAFSEWYRALKGKRRVNWRVAVADFYTAANNAVRLMAAERDAVSGCTCASAVIERGRVWVTNLGDSRVYLLRRNRFRRLTTDHTFAELLVRTRQLPREAAEHSRARNQLTGFIGAPESGRFDRPNISRPFRVVRGDRLLLCSDGLTDMLDEKQIRETIREGEAALCVRDLMNRTLAAGAKDNCTILLIEVL